MNIISNDTWIMMGLMIALSILQLWHNSWLKAKNIAEKQTAINNILMIANIGFCVLGIILFNIFDLFFMAILFLLLSLLAIIILFVLNESTGKMLRISILLIIFHFFAILSIVIIYFVNFLIQAIITFHP